MRRAEPRYMKPLRNRRLQHNGPPFPNVQRAAAPGTTKRSPEPRKHAQNGTWHGSGKQEHRAPPPRCPAAAPCCGQHGAKPVQSRCKTVGHLGERTANKEAAGAGPLQPPGFLELIKRKDLSGAPKKGTPRRDPCFRAKKRAPGPVLAFD